MKNEIRRILAGQTDNISFVEKGDRLLVNLDCYAIAGYAAEEILDLARKNNRGCVFSIQTIDDPRLQITLWGSAQI